MEKPQLVLIQFAVLKYIYCRNKFERYHSEILTKSYWSRILWSLARTTSQLWLLHNFYLLPASSLLQHFLCFFFSLCPFIVGPIGCRPYCGFSLLLLLLLLVSNWSYVQLTMVSNWCWCQIVHQSIYPIG